jgi:WS/DGAT/MGAT family acyltransferase
MLLADDRWPQDVGLLGLLDGVALLGDDGQVALDAVRAWIEPRLDAVPRLRQVLSVPTRGLGRPVWVDDAQFDLHHHVRTAPVAPPGDEAELLATVERLRRCRLDRSRPLWEMWLLSGLPEGRVGLFARVHHVAGDGLAGITTFGRLLAPVAPTPRGRWEPSPPPTGRDLVADNLRRTADLLRRTAAPAAHPARSLRRARAAWSPVHDLFTGEPASETSLNRLVGPGRAFALARAPLDLVHATAKAHDATINDVLLTAVAGGVRELLRQRGEPADDLVVPIYVPVSLRGDRQHEQTGNRLSQIVLPLPLGAGDPGATLEQIAAETRRRKAMPHPPLGSIFRGRLLGHAMLRVVAGKRVNLTSADLVGPPSVLSLAGAPLLEMFPLLNLIGNVTLGVSAISYRGRLGLMAVGDADTYPDLDVFATAFRRELAELTEPAAAASLEGAAR